MVGNGYADVKKVEGNTIVWNSILPNGDFSTANYWQCPGYGYISIDTVNQICTFTANTNVTNSARIEQSLITLANHIYYIICFFNPQKTNSVLIKSDGELTSYITKPITAGVWNKITVLTSSQTNGTKLYFYFNQNGVMTDGDTVQVSKASVIDLTKMFGSGKEPSLEEFERLFPMEYAPYCEGRLVSLGGYKIKWNQLVQNGDFSSGAAGWSVSNVGISVSDGVLTCTSLLNVTGGNIYTYPDSGSSIGGHKYYISVEYFIPNTNESLTSIAVGLRGALVGVSAINVWTKYSGVSTVQNSSNIFLAANLSSTSIGDIFKLRNINVFDLTEMFGPGSEPTLEEFEAMFGTEYCPYDEGTEMNVLEKMGAQDDLSVKSTGFNQWNGTYTEYKAIHGNDGLVYDNGDPSGATDFIPVIGGETYYFSPRLKYASSINTGACYDANRNYISELRLYTVASGIVTLPENARYIRLTIYMDSATDPYGCINLSDPAKNGTYLPYTTSTQDLSFIYDLEYTPSGSTTPEKLFPYGLLSAGDVHDEITDTQAIKRIGVIDLGNDLTWTGGVGQNTRYSSSTIPNCKTYIWANYQSLRHLVLFKYTLDGSPVAGNHIDNTYVIYTDGNMYVNDYTCESLESFINYMKNRLLYYELATPITVTFPTPKDLGYNVQSGGTEQLLPSNPAGTGSITSPIIESVNYPLDAVGTLTNLPKNYISVESMDSFTTALGNAMNLNITKTWDSTDNKWSFSVTSRS